MDKISAVIITKNEEKNIRRCIKSIEDIVDEIIVVDSFSVDNTEKICNEHSSVKFVKREFEDYSTSKNYGNSLAQHPFIFSIDADEEVSDELKESLLLIKSDLKEDGYSFNRRTNYCGHWVYHCGWYPDTKLRLFRKSKANWKGKIHETLQLSTDKIIHLKGDLLHYSFYSIEQHVLQANNFTNKLSLGAYKKGRRVNILKIIIHPFFRFIRDYFFKRGFLDGYYGFIICMISANANFLKYIKIREMQIKDKKTLISN